MAKLTVSQEANDKMGKKMHFVPHRANLSYMLRAPEKSIKRLPIPWKYRKKISTGSSQKGTTDGS